LQIEEDIRASTHHHSASGILPKRPESNGVPPGTCLPCAEGGRVVYRFRDDVTPVSQSRWLLVLTIILLACSASLAGESGTNAPSLPGQDSSTGAVTGAVAQSGTNGLWFPVGESMTYGVYWGFIPVGEAVVSTSWVEDGGVRRLQIEHRIRSNKVLAVLYPVDDKIKTLIDPVTFRPISFYMDQNEGRRSAREITTFNYEKNVANWESFTKKKTAEYSIDQDTRDLVTFMYFMRRDGFKPGDDRQFRVKADDTVYDLGLKVVGEDKVDVPGYGEIDCLRIEPTAKFNGLFVRKGKMTLWVSRDKRCLCTRIVASVPVVGSVKAILTSLEGGGDDAWTAKSEKPDNSAVSAPAQDNP
jgi:hypothetical protein